MAVVSKNQEVDQMARAEAIADWYLSPSVEYGSGIADTDDSLVERLRAGEREAFELLVRTYQAKVYSLLYHLIGNSEDARDATQETFLRIYCKVKQFRGECRLRTWIYRVALNQAANYRRWWKRRRRDDTISIDCRDGDEGLSVIETLADDRADPEQVVLLHEQRRQLIKALEKLKPRFRTALILRDVEGLSYEEIAAALKLSIGTVKSRIARARDSMRQELHKLEGGPNGRAQERARNVKRET